MCRKKDDRRIFLSTLITITFVCLFDWLIVLGLTKCQPLWVILCHLSEKGRKEKETIVEETKERDREERGKGM